MLVSEVPLGQNVTHCGGAAVVQVTAGGTRRSCPLSSSSALDSNAVKRLRLRGRKCQG